MHPACSRREGPLFTSLSDHALALFRDDVQHPSLRDLLSQEARGVVADLGCGPGAALPYLSSARQIHAIDRDHNALTRVQAHCRQRGLTQVVTQQADLAHYSLNEPADFSLLALAFCPRNLQDAVRILCNVQTQTRSGAPVLLILPALEAELYWQHLQYRRYFEEGEEEEALQPLFQETSQRCLAQAGPGGDPEKRRWSKEELINLVMSLHFRPLGLEKQYLPWKAYFPGQTWCHPHRPLWHWRWLLLNP